MKEFAPTRCCGLLAGLGIGATVHYYRALAAARERQGRPSRLVMTHVDVHRVLRLVNEDGTQQLAEYLATFLHQLRRLCSQGLICL